MTAVVRDLELVVSELMTNAIRAALDHAAGAEPQPVRLRLSELPATADAALAVRAEVWDASSREPQRQAVLLDAPGGRGLMIVEAVSSRWGCYPAESGGKVVWAEITNEPGAD